LSKKKLSQENLAKSAQKLFFATMRKKRHENDEKLKNLLFCAAMRKKRQPNAEKRDFLLINVTFCHGKKHWRVFCISRPDATK
jgi:hypothetical protein